MVKGIWEEIDKGEDEDEDDENITNVTNKINKELEQHGKNKRITQYDKLF